MLDMIARPLPATPANSVYSDMEDKDNEIGPERDETDSFFQLVRLLMADDQEELSRKLAEINRRSSEGSGR
ncbi:hypothetical protein [Streptomyces sp. NBC_01264]|uniref:hypothetical protein n=1 Tax=Streptomyces sp. NBC_01264 TaxID=2903804 RepID=UPI002255964D|nr:hypothetical protein [Streptomyces sp. NBC_01264]MCX4784461.1 hypothetical protein [Streptomyces sp. NBC_01264]